MTFDRFWATYPRRVGKGAALKSWEKLNPDDNLTQEILLAIQAQIRWKHEAKKTGEFVPDWCHPATWLNQQRYLDELGSYVELREKHPANECAAEGCKNQALKTGLCEDHEAKRETWKMVELREHAKKLGLTTKTTRNECLELIRQMNPILWKILSEGR